MSTDAKTENDVNTVKYQRVISYTKIRNEDTRKAFEKIFNQKSLSVPSNLAKNSLETVVTELQNANAGFLSWVLANKDKNAKNEDCEVRFLIVTSTEKKIEVSLSFALALQEKYLQASKLVTVFENSRNNGVILEGDAIQEVIASQSQYVKDDFWAE